VTTADIESPVLLAAVDPRNAQLWLIAGDGLNRAEPNGRLTRIITVDLEIPTSLAVVADPFAPSVEITVPILYEPSGRRALAGTAQPGARLARMSRASRMKTMQAA